MRKTICYIMFDVILMATLTCVLQMEDTDKIALCRLILQGLWDNRIGIIVSTFKP